MAQNDPWDAFSAPVAPAAVPAPLQDTLTPQDRSFAAPPLAKDPWDSFSQPVTAASSPQQFEQPKYNGLIDRAADMFTGAKRTEFPDAPEFLDAVTRPGKPKNLQSLINPPPGQGQEIDFPGLMRSAITSDPAIALQIIRKTLPNVEAKQDKFGNVMLRVPGVDWAYLNKPGFSARDVDELGTQTLATLPFMGVAGQGATIPARIASGAGFLGAGEITRQGLERAAGSEEPGSGGNIAAAAIGGGALAPGVPSALVRGAIDTGRAIVSPITNVVRGASRADDEAARMVAERFQQGSQAAGLGPGAPNLGGRPITGTPEELQHRGANLLQERAGPSGTPYGEESRLLDIGGEPTRSLARWAANVSNEAKQTLEGVINPRFETQGARVGEFLQNLNEGPTAQQSREVLQEMARTARRPFYETAFREGDQGLFSREIQNLTQAPAMQDAMRVAETEFQNSQAAGRAVTPMQGENGPTLEYWDHVKRALNDQFNRLAGQGRNSAAANVAALTDRLVGILDRNFGSYANARGVAHGFFRANDALEAGGNFATGRFNNDAARRAVETLNPMEQDLFRQGYVERTLQQINERGDRRNLLNSLQHSAADRERLEIALGPELAHEFHAALASERLIDLARGAVSGNSTTARQLYELTAAGTAGGIISGFDPHDPAGWIAAVLTHRGLHKLGTRVDTNIANRVAQMLVSRDPTVYRQGLRVAQGNRPIMDALTRADQAIDGLGRNAAIQNTVEPSQDTPETRGKAAKNAMGAGLRGDAGNDMLLDENAMPTIQEGATATNPSTSERIIYKGGKWRNAAPPTP